jgi:flagellar biosynthesis protein FliQ
MTQDFVLHLFREAFYTTLLLSAPILLVSLVVGLFVSVIQAATSIQEFTLTFVPKAVLTAIVLILTLPWMMDVMTGFTRELFAQIPALAR